jgi:hypothetical protein
MVEINSNKDITVSRFDTFTLRFKLQNYLLTKDDKFVFAIKATANSTETLYEASFYNAGSNYIDVVVPKGALDNLEPGAYIYDTAIINDATGKIITCFFTKAFVIKGVAHNV